MSVKEKYEYYNSNFMLVITHTCSVETIHGDKFSSMCREEHRVPKVLFKENFDENNRYIKNDNIYIRTNFSPRVTPDPHYHGFAHCRYCELPYDPWNKKCGDGFCTCKIEHKLEVVLISKDGSSLPSTPNNYELSYQVVPAFD